MANTIRYLVTVDGDTGATLRVQKVGESGELTEVAPQPVAAGVVHPPTVVLNLFVGSHGVAAVPAHTMHLSGVPTPGTGVPTPGTGVPTPGTGVPTPGTQTPPTGAPKSSEKAPPKTR